MKNLQKMNKNDKSIESVKKFISDYPDGKYLNEAKEFLEFLNLKKSITMSNLTNILTIGNQYLIKYPKGKFHQKVENYVKECKLLLKIKRAKGNDFKILIDEYYQSQLENNFIGKIKEYEEEYKLYLKSFNDKSQELRERYLKNHPKGKYFQEINIYNQLINYKSTNQEIINLLEEYFNSYNEGIYHIEIQKLIIKLLEHLVKKNDLEKVLEISEIYIVNQPNLLDGNIITMLSAKYNAEINALNKGIRKFEEFDMERAKILNSILNGIIKPFRQELNRN